MVRGLQVGPPDNKNNNNIKYRYGRYVSSCGIPPGFFCFDLLTPLFIIDSPIPVRLLLPRTDFYEIYWDLLALVPNIQATVLGYYITIAEVVYPSRYRYSKEYQVLGRVIGTVPSTEYEYLPAFL